MQSVLHATVDLTVRGAQQWECSTSTAESLHLCRKKELVQVSVGNIESVEDSSLVDGHAGIEGCV